MELACIVGVFCLASQSLSRSLEEHEYESKARIIGQG